MDVSRPVYSSEEQQSEVPGIHSLLEDKEGDI
jgi:hypothetical protein